MRNLVAFLTCLALPLAAMADTFTVELEPGWNLVSMPITPDDPNPDSVFGNARLGPVWEWRGVYDHAQEIRALQGYWVFCERGEGRTADTVTVEIVGTPPPALVPAMALGWSMVGTIGGEVEQLLAASRSPVFGWDGRRQYYRVLATPEAPTTGPQAAADPQKGFWVFMPGDYLVIDVSAGPTASTYPVSYLSAMPAADWLDEYKTTQIVLRRIPAGTFIRKLRDRTGLTGFDLPTEAQREYAARAATTTALNSGKNLTATASCPNMTEIGRYWFNGGSSYTPDGNASVGTAKVGSYLPNAWGCTTCTATSGNGVWIGARQARLAGRIRWARVRGMSA